MGAVSAAFFVIQFVRHPAFLINAAFRPDFSATKREINLFRLTAVEPLNVVELIKFTQAKVQIWH